MQKFLVVSYDPDEQQWFWDFVAAHSAEKAARRVCKDRPYVIAADATSLKELCGMELSLAAATVDEVEANYIRIIEEA